MNRPSPIVKRLRHAATYYLARLRERLWLKPLVSCVLSILAAFVATLVDRIQHGQAFPDVSPESVETLLAIISSSMLVIATFAVGAMVSAYVAASESTTPRSLPLVMGDDLSQNALSTFIGAFIYSIVATTAFLNGAYGRGGRFALFLITIGVFAIVILSFVRWVDRIARLGRVGNTIDKVETAANTALTMWGRQPTLGTCGPTDLGDDALVVPSKEVGYIQNIDVGQLQSLAEQIEGAVCVHVQPGTFVTPGQVLATVRLRDSNDTEEPDTESTSKNVLKALVIGQDRTFESDPRFGLIALSEVASRALSPAVNDPGTAIKVIGSLVRLFVEWKVAIDGDASSEDYDRVAVPPMEIEDLMTDAFHAISRDGGATLEVAIRLQKAFGSLASLGHDGMAQAAAHHARRALRQSEQRLHTEEDLETLRSVFERFFDA